ncbi:MAG TPA: SDR family oxidoreductase [Pleomorphomonadaceae bacterium]|nr:SDR family oxidoreductase [Pleomorphomonadaceae bacterium]
MALVTGAASGIGAASARALAALGVRVVIADIQVAKGEGLAKELGDSASFFRTDVTVEADVAGAVDHAVSRFGGLDLMVNNAGVVGAVGSIRETTLADWNATIAVLLGSAFLGVKHAARVMVPRGRGSIINIASVAGVVGGLGPHAYTAAKHGVIGLTRSASSELAASGVRVNAIAPGAVVTPMTAQLTDGDVDEARRRISQMAPSGAAIEADDIAQGVLYLASDAARHVTGHTLVIDSGLTTGAGGAFHAAPAGFTGPTRG